MHRDQFLGNAPLPRLAKGRAGFTLLEVMLAIAIFGLVIVGLASSLNRVIDAGQAVRREAEIQMNLETRLAEARQRPLAVGLMILERDATGLTYEREVRRLDLNNDQGHALGGLFAVRISAKWSEGAQQQERTSEIYVYQP